MEMENKNYISVEETAEYLNISLSKAYELCRKRSFPSVKLGVAWKVNKNALDEWFLKQARTKDIR